MAYAGLVTMGASVKLPNLLEWIDNAGGDSWLTIDNRLSVSLGVVPAYAEGSPDQGVLFQVPALHRSTVPIDPGKGVQLVVLDGLRFAGIQAPPLATNLQAQKRSCPYLLHSAGGAPTEPLYPVDSLVPALLSLTLAGTAGINAWVGPSAPNTFVPAGQLASAPADTAIIAATVVVLSGGYSSTPDGMTVGLWMDLDAGAPALGGIPLLTQADSAGSSVTVACLGAPAIQLVSGTVGDNILVALTAWLGVPPS